MKEDIDGINVKCTMPGRPTLSLEGVPKDALAKEVLEQVIREYELPANDGLGREISYVLKSEASATHLLEDQRIGDVCESGDSLTASVRVHGG